MSKINSSIQSLALPYHVLETLDDIVFRFLWTTESNKKGREKLNRNTLCLDLTEGGLSMISVKDQQRAFLIKWLHRVNNLESNSIHYKIVNNLLLNIGGLPYVLQCNIPSSLFKGFDLVKSHYWRNAISAWLDYNSNGSPTPEDCFTPIPIFNNSKIVHNNSPLLFPNWIKNNVKYIHDIITNGRFKSYQELQIEIGPDPRLLFNFYTVKNSVMKSPYYPSIMNLTPLKTATKIDMTKLENKAIRQKLIKDRQKGAKCKSTWINKIGIDPTPFFTMYLKATKESKLRALQFKIFHHIYPTNKILAKMNVKENENCDICGGTETLSHLFFSCPSLKHFWEYITRLVSSVLKLKISIDEAIALFGITPGEINAPIKNIHISNHLILLAKMSISKSKVCNNQHKGLKCIFDCEKKVRDKYFPLEPD